MANVNVNDSWARLEAVIVWAGMTTNFFARHIGLSRAENLYQIKSGKNGLSRNLAARIVAAFPEISAGWLLTGEGSMLSSAKSVNHKIPFYEGDGVWKELQHLHDIEPSSFVSLPALGTCDCALRCNDEAMMKEIMPGTIVFLKRTDVKMVIPGSMCVIASPNFVLLRRIRTTKTTDGREVLRLEPSNRSFDTMEVDANDITAIYNVVGALRLF